MNWSDNPGSDPTNSAMIKRDEPAAEPVAAGDPLAEVHASIVTALEATRIAGATGAEVLLRARYVLDEVRKLLAPKPIVIGTFAYEIADDPTQGLTAEHRLGDRWSVTP